MVMDEDAHHDIYPWRPFRQVIRMSDEQLRAYYNTIWNDPRGLSTTQRRCLENHVADVCYARRHADLHPWRRAPIFTLIRYFVNVICLLVHALGNNIALPLTHPLDWAYSSLAYIVVFSALSALQVALTIGHYLRLPALMQRISNNEGQGQTVVSWSKIGFFTSPDKDEVFEHAFPILASPPPLSWEAANGPLPPGRSRRDKIYFDVDVAKALVVLCGLVYERDQEYVHRASQDHERSWADLLRSEELMHSCARRWKLEFTSISDFQQLSGPFVGAFFKIHDLEPDQHPFVIIVFKGTTPTDLVEWSVDGTFNLETAVDFLGAGLAHSGFFNSLFPAPSSLPLTSSPSVDPSELSELPYDRILSTIKLISSAAKETSPSKTLQVFVTGHSLGAGMASLFYARLLESPHDVDLQPPSEGIPVEIRDAYLYGTPRSCSGDLVSRVEHNLRSPINARSQRMVFRVCNRDKSTRIGDIVARVPPGLCDERQARTTVSEGSLLSYGHIGIGINITPHAPKPHYRIGPVPVGSAVDVVSSTSEADHQTPSSSSSFEEAAATNAISWSVRAMNTFLPFIADHAPTSYFHSLTKIHAHHVTE